MRITNNKRNDRTWFIQTLLYICISNYIGVQVPAWWVVVQLPRESEAISISYLSISTIYIYLPVYLCLSTYISISVYIYIYLSNYIGVQVPAWWVVVQLPRESEAAQQDLPLWAGRSFWDWTQVTLFHSRVLDNVLTEFRRFLSTCIKEGVQYSIERSEFEKLLKNRVFCIPFSFFAHHPFKLHYFAICFFILLFLPLSFPSFFCVLNKKKILYI